VITVISVMIFICYGLDMDEGTTKTTEVVGRLVDTGHAIWFESDKGEAFDLPPSLLPHLMRDEIHRGNTVEGSMGTLTVTVEWKKGEL